MDEIVADQSKSNDGEFLEEEEENNGDNDTPEIQGQVEYNKNNYISGPQRVENGSVPMDILTFDYSYGYDCRKYFNLCVADSKTLIFSSGAFIHIFDVENNQVTFQRCSTGIGIGHIAKNPQECHIAVGETGENPPIIIYEWPSMDIVRILHNGTDKNYSHLAYSPDGKLLLSQGSSPDYSLTIWNWIKSIPLLRSKSYEHEIYNAIFSPSIPGHLVTSGSGHIKFWKMSKTFTGLKLEGVLGKFGKTEISDIIGLYSMPDEKIISGCEWGNILVWEEGLIKLEVRRKNNKPCHTKMITQFEYNNGDLMSIGMDGWLRIWSYETIDQTDASQDKGFIEIEPINEFEINFENSLSSSSMIMALEKKYPGHSQDKQWYGQDGNGGLWLIDLSMFDELSLLNNIDNKMLQNPTRKLLTCHAGPVMDMSTCSWDTFLATIGSDCHLHVYNYAARKLMINHNFNDRGSAIIWLPCSLDKTGTTIICGFHSGVIRVVAIELSNNLHYYTAETDNYLRDIKLIQAVKPHTDQVTTITTNPSNKLLITGSKDSTIFLFSIENHLESSINLIPIGFIKVPSAVTRITWKPQCSSVILIGCAEGHFGEIKLPINHPVSHEYRKTYELNKCCGKFVQFRSIKSALKREIVRRAIEKEIMEKREIMRKKMEEYRSLNRDIDIDEETFLDNSEETPPPPPPPLADLHIPRTPNSVQTIDYTSSGSIWLSVGGYDAGYIYEYSSIIVDKEDVVHNQSIIEEIEPLRATLLQDADDLELQSSLVYNDAFIFLGLEHGELRVCRIKHDDYTDFSDYLSYPVHDYSHGYIKKILLSHDQQYLFTCGYDGNIFSFRINDNTDDLLKNIKFENNDTTVEIILNEPVEDIMDPIHYPSLEQVIITNETNRIMSLTKKNRDHMFYVLRNFTKDYQIIMERNRALIKSQQIPSSNFKLDDRIVDDLNSQLQYEMDLINQRMAFKIEKNQLILKKLVDHFLLPITCLPFVVSRISKPDTLIYSVRERKLSENFQTKYPDSLQKNLQAGGTENNFIFHQQFNIDDQSDDQGEEASRKQEEIEFKIDGIASFLQEQNFSTEEKKLTVEVKQMLRRYNIKKIQMEKRSKEWKIMHASKPDPNSDHPDDIKNVEIARRTIGDYKLKISTDYSIKGEGDQETTLSKYKQLLDCRKKCHYLRESFNDRLKLMREKKLLLQNEVENSVEKKLNAIHSEIPKNYIKELPEMKQIDTFLEYPENNLKVEKYISMAEKVKEARKQKQSVIDETMQQALDEEFKTILPDESLFEYYSDLLPTSLHMREKKRIKQVEVLVPNRVEKIIYDNERMITPWEREMKTVRLSRKLNEQDSIVKDIEIKYEDIDRELDDLEATRLEVCANGVYSELYKLTLHQELVVLRDAERMETSLRENVNCKLQDKAIAIDKLQTTIKYIDKKNRDIKSIQNKMKEQTAYFMNAIQDNKYSKFLMKIFKKKVKTQLPEKTDSAFSQVSSDSSDETSTDQGDSGGDDDDDDDDGGSVDVFKIALTTFDENTCPPDCSRELYDLAFSMRLKRHNSDNEIREEQKNVESLMRQVDYDSKKIKIIEAAINDSQQTLNNFIYDKQRKLNDIDMTLILNFHQLEHFTDESNHLSKISNSVVFDTTRLSQLYTRVGELQQETCDQKMRHKKNCIHLHRMNIDCKYMYTQINQLKMSIKEEMLKKFGCSISLVSLYEAVVRRLIYDIKASISTNSKYQRQFKCLKERYDEHILILENLIRDNTEKLSVLTVLTEEQIKLHKIIKKSRPQSSKNIFQTELEWRNDLSNLEGILNNQKEQKELFRNNMRNLKLKIRSLSPITSRKKYLPSINKIVNKNNDEQQIITVKDGNLPGQKTTISHFFKDNKHDSAFRIIRNLLSKTIEQYVEPEKAESIVADFLNKIFSNHSTISPDFIDSFMEICDKIEKRIEEISTTTTTTTEIASKIRDIILEYANEIISQLEIESRGIGVGSIEISWNVKPKLDEFLDSMEIKKDIATEVYIMKFLKMETGLELATDYVLTKLPTKPNSETAVAFREHALRTLREIQKHIEGGSETETTL